MQKRSLLKSVQQFEYKKKIQRFDCIENAIIEEKWFMKTLGVAIDQTKNFQQERKYTRKRACGNETLQPYHLRNNR